jgi:predicted RNase H-like HicB family nuclease
MSKLGYPCSITILSAEEGGGYLIEFPDLPGCISDGETIGEAIVNGEDAILCWIETAKRYGDEIPQPRSSVDFPELFETEVEQDENSSGVDLDNVIREYEPFPEISSSTWQFDWAVTYP